MWRLTKYGEGHLGRFQPSQLAGSHHGGFASGTPQVKLIPYRFPSQLWGFPQMGVYTPKSSILVAFSLVNHPLWDITAMEASK